MDLNEYTTAAIKTESVVRDINTNEARLLAVLELSIAAGNMLDDLKKNIFYGKEINNDKFFGQFNDALNSVHSIDIYETGGHKTPRDQNSVIEHYVDVDTRIFHGVIGMATESTEMLEALRDYILTGELDDVNMVEELGDSSWYQAILLDAMSHDWNKMMEKNIKKLKARYKKQKFAEIEALSRDLNSERKILET